MSNKLSSREFWNKYWNKEKRGTVNFVFSKIVDDYIDFGDIDSYMEIGGAPGTIMTYMNKIYGLKCHTIDYVDKCYTENTLKENGITDYRIYEEDFIHFNTLQHGKRYGLVASWGFIEHFDQDTCKKIIQKQKELVGDKGYLIIELPNIRKLNWLIYRICNYELLKIHNLDVMDLSFLRNEILWGGNFEILYCDYYLSGFWALNNSNEFYNRHVLLKKIFGLVNMVMKKMNIDNIKSQFFSPYIVIIARKK